MATVTLLSHTPNPETLIAAAAKLCYSPATVEELMQNLTPEKVEQFLAMLASIGHESPLEHVSFTFAIEGVSRSFLAQITRHRIASYSVQSQRYVREEQFDFVLPPAVAAVPKAKDAFLRAMQQAQKAYEAIAEPLKAQYLEENLRQGMPEKQARSAAEKKAIEDARFVLPNACTTKMMVTMNVRSLHNFFHHRCCNRAQWEIRDVADRMLRLVSQVAPSLFLQAGPPCLSGPCPEGKMSCGKMKDEREKYKEMKEETDERASK